MTTARASEPVSAETRATIWLSLGILALPWLQTLEWDFDRSAPLALLPVALIAGHAALLRAIARIAGAPLGWRLCGAVVLLSVVLSTATSAHWAAATVQLASWALLALGALLAGQLVAEDRRRAEVLLGALAASGALATILHWTKWQLGAPPHFAYYAHGRLMGLHLLGTALAATALVVTAQRFRGVWFVAGTVCWGGLLWTGSRSPLVGLLAALAIWFARAEAATRRRLLIAAAVHAVAGFALSSALPAEAGFGWGHSVERTLAASSARELTSNRADFWREALAHAQETLWLGRGADAYRFLQPKLEGNQAHNLLLQWLLDFGLLGALPLTAGAGLCAIRAWRGLRRDDSSAGWHALAVGSLVAGQLDGYFYHYVGLFTAALALGIVLLHDPAPAADAQRLPTARVVPLAGLAAAAVCILSLHTWLFNQVALTQPPALDSAAARLWHAFPSTTLGVDRWIDAWETSSPDAALNAARLAARQSPNADYFHVKIAGLLLRRGDIAAARAELAHALTIAPVAARPVIAQLEKQLAAEAAKP